MRILLVIFGVLASVMACADEPVSYEEGIHYHELDTPVRTVDPDKIEVTEVFWYGCGHCYHFAPMMQAWAEKQADDVVVRHSPAIWRDVMNTHARIFYTAKALGKLDEMHSAIFSAMHEHGKALATEDEIAEIFAAHGVDKETFSKTFSSFGVKSQVQQADARQRSYGVTGTPSLVVDGRYRISGTKLEGGQAEMLTVADFLVNKIREEK